MTSRCFQKNIHTNNKMGGEEGRCAQELVQVPAEEKKGIGRNQGKEEKQKRVQKERVNTRKGRDEGSERAVS